MQRRRVQVRPRSAFEIVGDEGRAMVAGRWLQGDDGADRVVVERMKGCGFQAQGVYTQA